MSDFPEVVFFRVTNRCEHDCKYCYAPKFKKEPSFPEIKKALKTLKENEVEGIVLTGGEPLIREDITKILKEVKKNKFTAYLDTNGNNFSKHKKAIEKYVTVLGLPLDFSNGEMTSEYRGKANTQKIIDILNTYKNKKEKPFIIKVGTVITKDNIKEIENIAEILKDKGIYLWKIYEFVPMENNAIKNKKRLQVNKNIFESATERIKKKYSKRINIMISKREDRTRTHFIINPDLSVAIPIDSSKICKNVIIGNIFDKDIGKKWAKMSIRSLYVANAKRTFNHRL